MTQLLPIVLMAALMSTDSKVAADLRLAIDPWWTLAGSLGSQALVLLVVGVFVRSQLVRADRGRARPLFRADRMLRIGSWAIVVVHVTGVVVLGWLDVVRMLVGDLPGVDELIALLPAVGALSVIWAMGYSIERRTRLATLMRLMDQGRPIGDMPTRGRYVLQQVRVQLLFLLVPLLLIVTAGEVLEYFGHTASQRWLQIALIDLGTPASALMIFILAPLLMRIILEVRRLPESELRDDLMAVCHESRVKVRQLLLWQTGGLMMNAAVMGLIRPLRYVLVTDGLIDAMSRRELIAVMAHEVGHVRRHHMPWLLITLMSILMLANVIVWLPLVALSQIDAIDPQLVQWSEVVVTGIAVLGALWVFGWVSRRFERQADTFAVQHMTLADQYHAAENSAVDEPISPTPPQHQPGMASEPIVTPHAAYAMTAALGRIAHVNYVDPDRPSWQHGSIAWRQTYLRSLIGQPVGRLSIDRVVRRIKVIAAAIVVLSIAMEVGFRLADPQTAEPQSQPTRINGDTHAYGAFDAG